MKKKTAIEVKDLSKTFELPHNRKTSLKDYVVHPFSRTIKENQEVLKNVSFEIKKGEFFGIVGRNGSGKSTLLKIIAGVYSPSAGGVSINGSLVPFIELGVGFNPELTARDNVYLNSSLLGFSREETSKIYDQIVEFAELEDHMDQKLKNFSSGMQVRLAFSIAIRAKTDILLIDEVLAVGDAAFQRKCFNVFKEIKKEGKTVVFVTHDMSTVKEYCTEALVLNDGKVTFMGDTTEAAMLYEKINFEKEKSGQANDEEGRKSYGNKALEIKSIKTVKDGQISNFFSPEDSIGIKVRIKANQEVKNPIFGIQIENQDDVTVFATNNKEVIDQQKNIFKKGEEITIEVNSPNMLGNGSYTVSAALKNNDRTELYDFVASGAQFEVAGWRGPSATLHPEHTMTIKKAAS